MSLKAKEKKDSSPRFAVYVVYNYFISNDPRSTGSGGDDVGWGWIRKGLEMVVCGPLEKKERHVDKRKRQALDVFVPRVSLEEFEVATIQTGYGNAECHLLI
uniref:Uncharacterized protein n=1 Tax=Vespula pensylvanica TaxID=30213 RepID=A0A834P1Q3_VESPE|nr:hypothetical protein H0235_007658 [Vespula pensylvanica]